jgi:hypothetical protein
LALVQAERGALAGRAEGGDAGAAVGQRLAGVRHQARQVDGTIFSEGRGEGDGQAEPILAHGP